MLGFNPSLLTAVGAAGGAEAPAEELGPELIINGDFSSGTGWTLSGDVPPEIVGGKLQLNVGPDGGTAEQAPAIDSATYRCVYTIDSITDGDVRVFCGGSTIGQFRTAPGTYSEDLAADGTNLVALQLATEGSIIIDNFSVKKVL